ncbi:MAG: minor capsid protein, partial [Helcococcus sp.]|nr:minor capsid protein [Helcococcus sp.]
IYNLKMKIARDELLQKYIDLELAKLGTKEEKLLEDRIFNETEEELKRQAGILGDSLISKNKVKDVFNQIVNDSHVSAHFSDYIWANIKELRNDLQNGLNRSILRGQNPNVWKKDLYKHFKGRFGKAEFAAKRLAVTETAIAQTKAGLISAKENGYDKVIVITEPGACKDCKPHDGNIVDLDEARMGDNVPIWHPFCRCTVAAYYELDENVVESEQSHKGINRDTQINKKVIESSQYDKKFNNLDENIDVIRKMREEARRMLNNRNGTVFEDLVFIDTETGKVLRSDNYEVPNTAKPTKKMWKMLKNSKTNTIIGIHNHPNSTIPSAEDLIVSYKRGYKYGLIVGHNGIIYKYKANKLIDSTIYNILFEKIMKNGYNTRYKDELIKAGIELEELR